MTKLYVVAKGWLKTGIQSPLIRWLNEAMGQVIKGTKKDQKAVGRITIQLQSEEGKAEVLEIDEAVDKSGNVRELVVEQSAEFHNTKQVSITERIRQLNNESNKMAKAESQATARRRELADMLRE